MNKTDFTTIDLPSSKSISNRVLIIRHLSEVKARITNLSKADDTVMLQSFLQKIQHSQKATFHCHNAGTTTRFLIALLSITEGLWTIQADKRMQQRPIKEEIDILNSLGACIQTYSNRKIFPLTIKGSVLKATKPININTNTTSQIISALILISAKIEGGLKLLLPKEQVSVPYITMTIQLCKKFNRHIAFTNQYIICPPTPYLFTSYKVEKDFSSACFFYQAICMNKKMKIFLKNLVCTSLQADEKAAEYFKTFGLQVLFTQQGAWIWYEDKTIKQDNEILFDIKDMPDVFPSLAVTAYFSGLQVSFKNVQSLCFKESNRMESIANELNKISKRCFYNADHFIIKAISDKEKPIKPNLQPIIFKTYKDHRIAMALSLISLILPQTKIDNKACVKKSFPDFFSQIKILQRKEMKKY